MPDKRPDSGSLNSNYSEEKVSAYSDLLGRDVAVNLLLPPDFIDTKKKYPLLLLNDGQDMEKLGMKATVEKLIGDLRIEPVIVAGVVAGDRMQEYGVTSQHDYS